MFVECPGRQLLAAVRRAQPATVPGHSGRLNPLAACVLIRATADGVSLSAFDTETGIRTDVAEATVRTPGAAVVEAEQLAATLSEIGDDDVTLTLDADAGTAKLSAPRAAFELPTHPPEQFPEVTAPADEGPWFELSPAAFRALVRRTTFAADKKGTSGKFSLNAVLIEREGPRVHFVATDTKRLAVASSGVVAGPDGIDGDTDPKRPHLVPVKVLAAADRAAETDAPFRVRLKPNQVFIDLPGWSICSTLIQGRFPPWRDILAKLGKKPTEIKLSAAEFATSVRLAAVATDAETRRLDITFKPALAQLKARGAKGAGAVGHACPGFDGPDTQVALDPLYLLDWLKAVGAAPITLSLNGPNLPAVFGDGLDSVYVVMPLSE